MSSETDPGPRNDLSASPNPSAAETQASKSIAAAAPEMNDDELKAIDQAIMDADPDFAKKLSDIGPDIGNVNTQDDDNFFDAAGGIAPGGNGPKLGTFMRIRARTFQIFKISRVQCLLFVKQTIPFLGQWIFGHLKSGARSLKGFLQAFAALRGPQKASLLVLVFSIVVAAGILWKSSTTGILPTKEKLFVERMDDLAERSFVVDLKGEIDNFYDSSKASQNVMNLKRMVVNIKRSQNSGGQPMAAIEIYLEGYAPEVILEVKDREAEFLDLLQREMEQMTYDQLVTIEGKELLAERLQLKANRVLTQGKVKRIYFKNFILKP